MHKDELIQIHTLLWQLKGRIQNTTNSPMFNEYEELGILPAHIHKSKSQHKKAVFLLGKCLAETMDYDERDGNVITPTIVPRLSERMDNLAKRKGKDEEKDAIRV